MTRRKTGSVEELDDLSDPQRDADPAQDIDPPGSTSHRSAVSSTDHKSHAVHRKLRQLFAAHFLCLSTVDIVYVCLICLFINETVFSNVLASLHISAVYNSRNFSALVPIWGAVKKDSLGSYSSSIFNAVWFAVIGVLCTAKVITAVLLYLSTKGCDQKKVSQYLAAYIVLMVVTVFVHLLVSLSANNPDNSAYQAVKTGVQRKINTEYQILSEDPFTQSFNLIMISGKCCGIDGPGDFSHTNMTVYLPPNIKDVYTYAPVPRPTIFYYPENGVKVTLKIPPACCKGYLFREGSLKEQFDGQLECASKSFSESDAFTVGCRQRFADLVGDGEFLFAVSIISVLISYLSFVVASGCFLKLMDYFDISDNMEH